MSEDGAVERAGVAGGEEDGRTEPLLGAEQELTDASQVRMRLECVRKLRSEVREREAVAVVL